MMTRIASLYIKLMITFALLSTSSLAYAENNEFSVLSLNLHGYHPMGEQERYSYINGRRRKADTNIFYFTPQELASGNKKRLKLLAQDIKELNPVVAFFQEVGAGNIHKKKTCEDFYKNYEQDNDYENTVLRLKRALKSKYKAYTQCRGNVGWVTNEDTFSNLTIQRKDKSVVYKKGDNPYPNGVLIEGMGALVRSDYVVLRHMNWNLVHNRFNHKVFVQALEIKKRDGHQKVLALNLHIGHKVAHIEQSIVIQHAIQQHLLNNNPSSFSGVIVAGDFNARLMRRSKPEVSMSIWEKKVSPYFDFDLRSSSNQKIINLKEQIIKTNNSWYKRWASINDPYELTIRVEDLLDGYKALFNDRYILEKTWFTSSLDLANKKSLCNINDNFEGNCGKSSRIDFILATKDLELKQSSMIYSKNSWTSLNGNSDHPGIYSKFSFK